MPTSSRDPSDYQWLCSPDAELIWNDLQLRAGHSPATVLKWLRQRLPYSRAAVLFEQLELTRIAKRKFDESKNWFWTKQLLEQASDQETSQETARDFPKQSNVLDICCGAGADSWALAERGCTITAVDACPIACALTTHNLRAFQSNVSIRNVHAMEWEWDRNAYVHIDPDRRSTGTRSSRLAGLSPTWESIVERTTQCRGLSLKLAPGMDWREFTRSPSDHQPHAIRFLSAQSTVRQQRWYWNMERWPNGTVTACIRLNQRSRKCIPVGIETSPDDWFHETFHSRDLSTTDRDIIVDSTLQYVGDYDPVMRAAHLEIPFAQRYKWYLVDSENGYLTHDRPDPHPMVRWFEVLESMPFDRKRLRIFSKSAKARSWELKSRNVDVDLEKLRHDLHVDLDAEQEITILIHRHHSQIRAVFARSIVP